MIQLKTKGTPHNITDTIVAKIVSDDSDLEKVCLSSTTSEKIFLTTTNKEEYTSDNLNKKKFVWGIPSLTHLDTDDIVLLNPNGSVYTLFRKKSPHNSLFITDRCNSNCLMCSQPPRNTDDLDYYFEVNSQLIKMIPPATQELGITGGEPTLLGNRFTTLLEMITENLPDTNIHILTNGRSFAWKNIPLEISKVKNSKIVFGIPLYSDYYQQHDYVVQAKGAFNQTILGFHNMARHGLRLELRVVLHQQTYKRLPDLAKYIYKNLPFVEHIAFMGLEYTGYTPKNSELLWMEPSEYLEQLEEATFYLEAMGMNVSIYNLQLCLLKPTLWKFARNSISDWKREYLDECNKCKLLNECGGVFATSKKHSNEIKAVLT
jgi:His-Xaa-Ser system radical SAM maturase HxsC